jgi:hypothetical protein
MEQGMNHYFCLTESSASARKCIRKLLDNQIDEHHISVVSNGILPLDEISVDDESKTWDSVGVVQRAIAIGGNSGMFAGLRAVVLPSIDITLAGSAIYAADMVRAGAPAIYARVLHQHLPLNLQIRLQDRIASGQLLIVLGIVPGQVETFDRFTRQTCPDIQFISDLGMAKSPGDNHFMELVLS